VSVKPGPAQFVPLFVSFFFGPLFLAVVVVAWFVCLFPAAPLFILFSWRGWLRCWQVTLAGLVCGLLFGGVSILNGGLYSTIQGPANLAMLSGVGAVIAYGFWWFGLFRNPAFGKKVGHSTLPALFPLPVLLGLGLLYVLFSADISDAFAMGSSATAESPRGTIDIRLANGAVVNAELVEGVQIPMAGEKVTIESRRRLTLLGKRYWVIWRSSQQPAN
jgi:hypothetical protein